VTASRRSQRPEHAASARQRARLTPQPGRRAAARAGPARTRTRRWLVITATGISGARLLSASLSAKTGSRQFYLLTAGLAATWTGGALAAGPPPWGRIPDHDNSPYRLVVMPVVTGAGAFGLFYGAARLARHLPLLNQAITTVLRYADDGSAPLVLLSAAANAVAEELFFRGALWSLTQRAHPLATTSLAYTAATAATRNPALTIAGAATSVLFGLHRRASGSVLAPALTHLTWSLLMLNRLPPLFRDAPQTKPPRHAATRSDTSRPASAIATTRPD
jgi:uncharacterized protein